MFKQPPTKLPLSFGSAETTQRLREKTGFLDRREIKKTVSRFAKEALLEAERVRAQEEASVAILADKLVGTSIRSAMISQALPTIGALAVNMNAAASNVDQALTNNTSAEVAAHIANRNAFFNDIDAMEQSKELPPEEARIMKQFAQVDYESDVMRSRQRETQAKDLVDSLYACAMHGINKAKEGLF